MPDPSLCSRAEDNPDHQQLKCPRCNSSNTKFCYFNNYNLSQPRHFCKSCRRYWTKGGALRNIPVGGGTRKKTKRAKRVEEEASVSDAKNDGRKQRTEATSSPVNGDNFTGLRSFDHLLLGGLGPSGLNMARYGYPDPDPGQNTNSLVLDMGGDELLMGIHGGGDGDCWSGAWSDLGVCTPGSTTFH